MKQGSSDLPHGLQWEIEPEAVEHDGPALLVHAAGRTDYFVDPAGAAPVVNAARAVALAPDSPWQFSARLTVDFGATFDAGALILWSDEGHFAKLCYEQSPQRRPMVVSVVTREASDDANAMGVEGDSVWLRVSGLTDGVYAFHASFNGAHWGMGRYFRLVGTRPMAYGISVQSPVGEGCVVRFENLTLVHERLTDLRDGS
jgi:uncharacterized protein